MKKRRNLGSALAGVWRALEPRARLLLAGVIVLFVGVGLVTCGGCGKRGPVSPPGAGSSAASPSSSSGRAGTAAPRVAGDAGGESRLLWAHAEDGDVESLESLAVHEGTAGLIEAAERDARLRPIAIRALGYARGWAQMPFLAAAASGPSEDEARLALAAATDLAARPRTSEDPEDAVELAEGCTALVALARDVARPKPRRVAAVRALRMMPCPKPEDIPSDLDAK